MQMKKLIGATVVSFLILVVAGFLIHSVWLGPTYRAMRVAGMSFRAEDAMMHKVWIIWLSDLVYAFLFVWIYARGVESKPWVGQGIRYGIIATLFTLVPSSMNEYVVYNLPYALVLKWMLSGLVVLVLTGLVVAAMCKKSQV